MQAYNMQADKTIQKSLLVAAEPPILNMYVILNVAKRSRTKLN